MSFLPLPENGFALRSDSWIFRVPQISGNVGRIFKSSFDLEAENLLIHFSVDEKLLHPFGILVSEKILPKIRANLQISIQIPNIFFENIKLRMLDDIECENFRENPEKIPSRENITKLGKTLKAFGKFSKIGKAFLFGEENEFFHPLNSLLQDLNSGKLEFCDFISFFGGGEGLTPAWDDFCCGLLLADKAGHRNKIQMGKNFFHQLLKKTTRQAFWEMKFAREGKSSLLFEDFLYNFFYSDIKYSEIVQCISSGETSGTDILCGVSAYFHSVSK